MIIKYLSVASLLVADVCLAASSSSNIVLQATPSGSIRGSTRGTFSQGALLEDRKLADDAWLVLYQSDTIDVSTFDDLRMTFDFIAENVELGKDFTVEYTSNDGQSWSVVERFVSGEDKLGGGEFINDKDYFDDLIFSKYGQFALTSAAKIRFRCHTCCTEDDSVTIKHVSLEGLTDIFNEVPSLPVSSNDDVEELTFESVCPIQRQNPPAKFEIDPHPDSLPIPFDVVQDDLGEMSYISFSEHLDENGNAYAYSASDKEQFSLKVIKFTNNPAGGYLQGRGTVVAIYELNIPTPTNDDWEDISLGPCTDSSQGSTYSADQTCIYIANTGNNARSNRVVREVVTLFKFVEPTIGADGPVSQIVDVVTINFRYGVGFAHATYDSEAMFVDWVGEPQALDDHKGDIYVPTKSGGCGGGVGKIPVSFHKNLAPGQFSTVYNMPNIMEDGPPQQLSLKCTNSPFRSWTGADMRRDGRLIAMIRTGPPAGIYFFPRLAGESVAVALSQRSCDYVSPTSHGLRNEKRHEAVAFTDTIGSTVVDLSECEGGRDCLAPIYFHKLIYPETVVAPILEPVDGWEDITTDNFEGQSWGNFRSGGSFAKLSNRFDNTGGDTCGGNCACGGDWAIKLYDGRGDLSSAFHSVNQECAQYDTLRVTYQYKSRGYDHLDTLFLEISLDGGLNYFIVDSNSNEVDFTNGICNRGHTLLQPEQFGVSTFGDGVRLRFRNSANAQNDRVYVDDIVFEGHLSS